MFKRENGFTLIELVASIAIIGIVIGSVVSLFNSIQSTQRRTAYMETATRSAQRQMESLRNNNYNNLTAGQTIDFSSQVPATLKNKSGTVTVTEPTTGLKRVDVTVSYKEGTTTRQVSLSSLVGILGITQ